MDGFTEALNRLKAVHEQEVLGLQNKLVELNSERCRDAQRAEELCAKNQHLREQQRALKDNVRVLENRLRAGLCDRCAVTQELARKKQQESENALLRHLQCICLLTNEMNRLQDENEALKGEVTRLRGSGPKPPCEEGTPDTTSPPPCTSPGARKATEEKLPGEEAEDHPPAEKLAYRMSPGARISPRANPAEPRAPDVSPQRISNQLHGTIAVVRQGAQACSTDRGSANGTPPALSGPPSPPYELGLPLDSFPRSSRPSAVTYASLKQSLQADHLCLLSHRLSLHLRSCHSSPQGPPPQGLKAGELEAWEEPPGLLGLSGPLVDLRGPRLEGALSLLLAQQLRTQGQADSARLRGPRRPGETLPSPPLGSDSEGPESEVARAALPGKRHLRPTGSDNPRAKEARTTQDHVPDKPLDLSEWGRGRDAPESTGRPGSLSPQTAHTPSPEPPQGAEPPAQSGPWGRSNGTKGTRAPEPEEPCTPEDSPQPLPGPQPNLRSPGRPRDESRERPKLSPDPQRPDTEGPPELSKPEVQLRVSDEPAAPDASDDEGGLSPKEPPPSTPGKAVRCFCTVEPRQGRPPKRKQAPSSDQRDKASKKLS
ncbi:RBBP8 N-terminal-like protein [Sturnira hondurensis]|uniref:RBBP8 N-terminal-like protein n=1 Tax=Sturnira hondurensis TaxID=192404 RepID=UPI001879999B|nr:RBBP8 N-terminal-like protein [Sturnira hondurensis]XP_036915920.1 RBBP8 N-terminal-like protein [Sturnira hondurensis]